jgi:hypothetical protein
MLPDIRGMHAMAGLRENAFGEDVSSVYIT